MEHSPSRGTSRCAPGAFSLTAPVFRSSRAQKGAWCARADLAYPYDTENDPVAYARHITSPVTALVGAAERQQVGTGGGSAYRRGQASASKDKHRCNQRQMTSAGRNKREKEQASASGNKRRCNQRQVAGRRRERTDGAGTGAGRNGQAGAGEASGNRSRQKRASAGRRHFMPYKKSASADRRGRGTLQRKVGKRLERRRGSGTCPVKKGGPAKRPAPLTPGSQVEKSSGFPYVGEETR